MSSSVGLFLLGSCAASIASLLLTTEGLVAELPEEEKAPKYPTPPGGDMY